MSIEEFNKELLELEIQYLRDKQELLERRNDWIGSQWPMYKSGRFAIAEFSQWECPKSPIGICIYDDEEDPIHDYCHFCGDPEERK